MSIENRFGKSVAWMAAGSWVEQGFNMLFFVALARLLGAEAFGIIAMAAAFVVFAEALVRESLSEFLIAEKDPAPGHFTAAFWLLAGLGLGLMLVLLLAAGPVARLYGEPDVAPVLRSFSPTVLMIALTAVPVAILRREMRFRILSIRAVAGVLAGGVAGIVAALAGLGLWALVIQQLVRVAANVVLAWGAVDWRPRGGPSGVHVRAVSGFGGQVLGLRLAELVAVQTPVVMIGSLLGATALGYFSLAWRLIELSSFLIVTPLRLAAQSAFAALNREGGGAAGLLQEIGRLSSLAAFPAFAGMAVLAVPVMSVLFGAGWLPAGPVLAALAPMGLYLCIERVQQSYCLAMGEARALTVLAWGEVILGAVLIWAVSGWGLVAVTLAASLRYFLLWPVRFAILSRLSGLPALRLVRVYLAPALATLVMAGAVWALRVWLGEGAPVLHLVAGITLGAVLFAGLVVMFMPDRLAELRGWVSGQGRAGGTIPRGGAGRPRGH